MRKVKNKLALYAVTVSFLCFVVTSSFFYIFSAYLIQENARAMGQTQLDSMNRSLEALLNSLEEETKSLTSNTALVQWLDPNRQRESAEANGLLVRAEAVMNDFVLRRSKEIEFVEIIPKDPNMLLPLSTNGAFASPLPYGNLSVLLEGKDSSWVQQAKLGAGTAYTVSGALNQEGKLAYIRKITGAGGEELGAVIAYARSQIWQQVLTGVRMKVKVQDAAGLLLYQDNPINGDTLATAAGSTRTSTWTSERTSWKLTAEMNTDRLLGEVKSIRKVIIAVGISCFVASVLLSVSISHRFTSPLHRIERLVVKIVQGKSGFNESITLPSSFLNKLLTNKLGIVTLYVFILLIPLLVSIFVLQYQFSRSIERETEAFYKDQLEAVSRKVDNTLTDYNHVLDYLFADKSLNKLMAQYVNGEVLPDEWEEPMDRLMAKVSGGELGLYLYNTKNEPIYSSGCKTSDGLKPRSSSSVRNETRWMTAIYACGTYTVHFGKELVLFENYKNSRFYDPLGSIVLGVNELQLERAYSAEVRQSELHPYLMDAEGRIVSHPNKLLVGTSVSWNWKEALSQAKEQGLVKSPETPGEALIVYHKLEGADWYLVGTLAANVIQAPIYWMRTVSYILLTTNLLVMALAIYGLFGRLLFNFRKLNAAMAEVANGDMEHRLRLNTGDELQRMADGFNFMMLRLKELMEDNYRQGIRRKEAELNALQAQINPHFLYNTLESINWEAMMMTGGSNKVSDMVTALSDLLRLSISHGKEIVPFGDEMNHVKNYLFIQKERYSDKFDVEWEIDPALYSHRILKLIVQPLVENAIYHGIELKEERGLIRLEAEIQGEHLLIRVKDDGLGMSEEQLAVVRDSLEDNDGTLNRGIGIRNVNERIQLYYGKAFGLHLSSEQGKGTVIEVRLPIDPQEGSRVQEE